MYYIEDYLLGMCYNWIKFIKEECDEVVNIELLFLYILENG